VQFGAKGRIVELGQGLDDPVVDDGDEVVQCLAALAGADEPVEPVAGSGRIEPRNKLAGMLFARSEDMGGSALHPKCQPSARSIRWTN
jgi:hypothetical protein